MGIVSPVRFLVQVDPSCGFRASIPSNLPFCYTMIIVANIHQSASLLNQLFSFFSPDPIQGLFMVQTKQKVIFKMNGISPRY